PTEVRSSLDTCQDLQVHPPTQILVKRRHFDQDSQMRANIHQVSVWFPKDCDASRSRVNKPRNHIKCRRFPCTVGSQETEDITFLHIKRSLIDRCVVGELLGQTLDTEDRRRARAHESSPSSEKL